MAKVRARVTPATKEAVPLNDEGLPLRRRFPLARGQPGFVGWWWNQVSRNHTARSHLSTSDACQIFFSPPSSPFLSKEYFLPLKIPYSVKSNCPIVPFFKARTKESNERIQGANSMCIHHCSLFSRNRARNNFFFLNRKFLIVFESFFLEKSFKKSRVDHRSRSIKHSIFSYVLKNGSSNGRRTTNRSITMGKFGIDYSENK